MENFSPKLKFTEVNLRTAADIVQHSFTVQDSISPLNLELCQSYSLLEESESRNLLSFSYSKDFINSEEKCWKILTSNRRLLYSLNLDFPKVKERSLKSEFISMEGRDLCKEFHIARIFVEDCFYTNLLADLVDYACSRSDDPLKFLKWFMKSDVFVKPDVSLPTDITNRVIDYYYPGKSDSDFVKDCFRKIGFHLVYYLFTKEISKHAMRINLVFQYYLNGRHPEDIVWFEPVISPVVGELNGYLREENRKCIKSEPPRRRYLVLQVLAFYIEKVRDPALASEFLRVSWNSFNDPFLSSKEITAAYETRFGSTTTADICNFYSEIVGDLLSFVEPRSLKHHCRTLIRKELYESVKWVSDGIGKLGLPKSLQSYLNIVK